MQLGAGNELVDSDNESKEKVIDSTWVAKVVKKFGLEQTLRGVGRPKKQ